ncbi:hypothetical protein ACQ4LE_008549 [Meloidogyne hapla]
MDANLGPSALKPTHLLLYYGMDANLGPSALEPHSFTSALWDGCKSRAFGPQTTLIYFCIMGWMQISGLRPSNSTHLLLHYGMDANLGPSALKPHSLTSALWDGCKSRAFGPQTNSFASVLRDGCKSRAFGPQTNSFASVLRDGCKSRAFGPRTPLIYFCIMGWMQISGLRPSNSTHLLLHYGMDANLGPSALKPHSLTSALWDGCKSRAFGPQTNSFASVLRDGCKSRAFGPRTPLIYFCIMGWMQISGLRPSNHTHLLLHYGMDANLGPSALKPTHLLLYYGMDANLGPSALKPTHLLLYYGMDANLGPSALELHSFTSALWDGCKSRAFGPRTPLIYFCIMGWMQISGLRPSNHTHLLLHYGMDANLGPSALKPTHLLLYYGMDANLGPSALELHSFTSALWDGCKSRAFGPQTTLTYFCIMGWMQISGLRPSNQLICFCITGWMQISGLRPSNSTHLLLHYGMDANLGPSALKPHSLTSALWDGCKSRAFGPQTNSFASVLRDGCKSRAFGPQTTLTYFCIMGWMQISGLRPSNSTHLLLHYGMDANLGPSALDFSAFGLASAFRWVHI